MSILSICLINGISIDIQWIPREGNTQADYLSKIIDYQDWDVSEFFLNFINELWAYTQSIALPILPMLSSQDSTLCFGI
jgi:hypothetical protein